LERSWVGLCAHCTKKKKKGGKTQLKKVWSQRDKAPKLKKKKKEEGLPDWLNMTDKTSGGVHGQQVKRPVTRAHEKIRGGSLRNNPRHKRKKKRAPVWTRRNATQKTNTG